MENVKLNNGVDMPCIGMGVFRMEDNKATRQSIETALEIGYRHIDTAAYYNNEQAVGKAIKSSGIPREEIFVTTKVWNDDQRSGRIVEALQTSLDNMDMEYVDLYLIHWPVPELYKQTWKVFEELYELKRVRAIGVSNFQEHHLEELKKISDIVPAINQVELHPYLTQQPLLDYCNKEGIQLEAWSPFAANKTDLLREEIITYLAEKYSRTPGQIILRWNYQRGVVTIPKSSNTARLKENISIFDFILSYRDMEAISSLNKHMRTGSDPDNFNF